MGSEYDCAGECPGTPRVLVDSIPPRTYEVHQLPAASCPCWKRGGSANLTRHKIKAQNRDEATRSKSKTKTTEHGQDRKRLRPLSIAFWIYGEIFCRSCPHLSPTNDGANPRSLVVVASALAQLKAWGGGNSCTWLRGSHCFGWLAFLFCFVCCVNIGAGVSGVSFVSLFSWFF